MTRDCQNHLASDRLIDKRSGGTLCRRMSFSRIGLARPQQQAGQRWSVGVTGAQAARSHIRVTPCSTFCELRISHVDHLVSGIWEQLGG
jgi:hypothetical protein